MSRPTLDWNALVETMAKRKCDGCGKELPWIKIAAVHGGEDAPRMCLPCATLYTNEIFEKLMRPVK